MIKSGHQESLFERRLARHTNPERSRRFEPKRWERSRRFLSELAKEDWLSSQGRLTMHIVGSNGKGSLAWYLSELSHKLYGLSPVGLFTSPHLLSAHERIRFDGNPISDELACQGLSVIENRLEKKAFRGLSYFELLTILMLYECKRRASPLLILEAGLGGRLDATRMAAGEIVLLTNISLEHTSLLGNSKQEILKEKLGIITQNTRYLFWPPKSKLYVRGNRDESLEQKFKEDWAKHLPGISSGIHLQIIQSMASSFWLRKKSPPNYLEKNFFRAREILRSLGDFYPELLRQKSKAASAHLDLHFSFKKFFIPRHSNEISPPPGRLEIRKMPFGEAAFDTAHNPDALFQSLHDFSFLLQEPLTEHLILLGLLKDRPLEACLAVFEELGLGPTQVFLYDQKNRATPPQNYRYGLLDKEKLFLRLGILQEQGKENLKKDCCYKGLVILGSHRNYSLFQELTQVYEKPA